MDGFVAIFVAPEFYVSGMCNRVTPSICSPFPPVEPMAVPSSASSRQAQAHASH